MKKYIKYVGMDNTKKKLLLYFHCGPSKKLCFCRTYANQQEHTNNLKLKFEKKSRQYDDNYNNNYYFIDNKDKK